MKRDRAICGSHTQQILYAIHSVWQLGDDAVAFSFVLILKMKQWRTTFYPLTHIMETLSRAPQCSREVMSCCGRQQIRKCAHSNLPLTTHKRARLPSRWNYSTSKQSVSWSRTSTEESWKEVSCLLAPTPAHQQAMLPNRMSVLTKPMEQHPGHHFRFI